LVIGKFIGQNYRACHWERMGNSDKEGEKYDYGNFRQAFGNYRHCSGGVSLVDLSYKKMIIT